MSRKKDSQDPIVNFEESLASLEAIVSSMEDGELSLEESLQAFEKGIRLTRECQSALQKAEQKVQVLMSESGEPEAMDLEGES
ncbi:MAG: exodeoxyribonuclease VII small subunit [Pseudomonadales bacterium]|nr:exodeoxyribonuclease VII small subunit [Pseudomonadales bacterium]MCP5330521.1 exodeoxyribonuclease VII small subunit [Pseudomonadales bacterium]MCP5344849.1 exodeoxyribonuclease VII small subunit [Pseudomonadales bacterium]